MFLKQAVKIPKPIRETRVAIAKNNPFYWPVHPSGKWLAGKGCCCPYSICLVVVASFLYILNPKAEVCGLDCLRDENTALRHQLFRGEFVCSRSQVYWRGPARWAVVSLQIRAACCVFQCLCLYVLCSALHKISCLQIRFKSAAGNFFRKVWSSIIELCLCLCLIVFVFTFF